MYLKSKEVAFVVMLLSLFVFLTTASEANEHINNVTRTNVSLNTLMWRTPLYAAINQYLSVVIHEYGHAAVGTLLGEKLDYVHIAYNHGETHFQGSPNGGRQLFISLAGPFTNRFGAAWINYYLDNNEYTLDENMRSFLATAYIANRLDFAAYLIFPSANYVLFGKGYDDDWSTIASTLSGKNSSGTDCIIASFIALELFDIYFTRDEIARNIDRMLGRYPKPVSPAKNLSYHPPFDISPYGKGFIVSKTLNI